ncbi:MAG: hypothetical protein H8K10_20940 [Nitrospira sp.]|nr:hypothetical protein [Nitrospira sp.]
MNHLLILTGIVFALSSFVGCSGVSGHRSMPARSGIPQMPGQSVPGAQTFQWRAEARELQTFADRHDVEAEVLLQNKSSPDIRMIQQRRALARQLRVAAAQLEQGAEQVEE